MSRTGDASDNLNVTRQQRWLIYLRHCAKCRLDERACLLKAQCSYGKRLWQHMIRCDDPSCCQFPDCTSSTSLLKHHRQCQVGAVYSLTHLTA
jgi:E1A/CREB-binding protein